MAYIIKPRDRKTQPTQIENIKNHNEAKVNNNYRTRWRGLRALSLWATAASIALAASVLAITLDPNTNYTQTLANNTPAGHTNNPIDHSLTTGSIAPVGNQLLISSSSTDLDSIHLTISSMQRQINALQSRNDRLEKLVRQSSANLPDNFVTNSINPVSHSNADIENTYQTQNSSQPSIQSQAAMAFSHLSANESETVQGLLANDLRNLNKAKQEIVGLDLGSGFSFDDLRTRWEGLKQRSPEIIASLNARAVLRENNNGLQAHLILGPVSGQEQAERYCSALRNIGAQSCRLSIYEGQKL